MRRGDDRAFEELYIRYRWRIGAYVQSMVRDHARAEEITQDVFLSAFRRMRDTERPIAFKPWIYEIAKNACIDNARRARHAQEVPLVAEDAPDGYVPLGGPTLEHTVAARQQLDDLRGAFGCLSASHHKILVLRELEGLSYQQIAERMGMSRPMVESTLFRARRRLGEEYEELVSGRRCAHVQSVVVDPGAQSLGVRERRRLARHLAHCQPCRRHAVSAGFDLTTLKPRRLASRVAALFPLPLLRLPWRLRQPRGRTGARDGGAIARLGTSPALSRSADAIASLPDPTVASIGLSRAVAAVAAIAITGAGGGFLVSAPLHRPAVKRAPAARIAPPVANSGSSASKRSSNLVHVQRGGAAGSTGSLQGPRTLSHPSAITTTTGQLNFATKPPRQFTESDPQPPVSTSGSPLRPAPTQQGGVPIPNMPSKLGVPGSSGAPLPPSKVPLPKVGPLALPDLDLAHAQGHSTR